MNNFRLSTGIFVAALGCALALAPAAHAAKKNPTSKLYVADLDGQSEIDTGERIEDLTEKSVHNAQGTVIQTNADAHNAMVFSNGTGVYLDPDTRMEIKRFVQEPFTPDRSDLEVEPSISQTNAFIPRGTVGLCTPRMIAGSSMVYSTPHSAMAIRGRKVVIQSEDFETKVSSIEGEVTVRGGPNDGGGYVINGGEQAIIKRLPGRAPQIEIRPIPDDELEFVEDKVTLACDARRTVYFDAKGKPEVGDGQTPGEGDIIDEATGAEMDDDGEGWANVFDDEDQTAGAGEEVVVVEVTPVEPVQETPVSASSI
ncbi:hypothetical protein [Actomonas aquatica]|uniref:FecR protein domain-containing protein n=1 Tax=Actomonas aquatica TaxID=2866162 RepID=A0ABZ1CA55_9BACT|nr:hypothetical protein [Opitutus sp. WL0086]WRQ88103.1 hypothetical protein K1X11_001705 [Opitutus sp. WL0086]